MPNVFTVISDNIRPYLIPIMFIISVIVFSSLAYYAYTNYYIPYVEKEKSSDVANNPNRKKIANIYFFFVDWCPHCKTAKPEWNSFKVKYNNTEVNGYIVKCYSINCTDDNGSIDIVDIPADMDDGLKKEFTTPVKITDLIRKYNIEAYPTIKMTKDNYTIDYDAKISADSLDKFVNTAL